MTVMIALLKFQVLSKRYLLDKFNNDDIDTVIIKYANLTVISLLCTGNTCVSLVDFIASFESKVMKRKY